MLEIFLPSTACAARPIIFILVNLETNGIERDARIFSSITYACSSLTKNCKLNGPLILNSLAILFVESVIFSMILLLNLQGGIHIIASPEWTPALSICSTIAPIATFSPSQTPSTSTSNASSMNFVITIG